MAKQKASTLNFVEVSEIRDDVIVLRDGQLCSVINISSANFALKSGEEQQMIIKNFQSFLNSIDFPVQILVQSRQLQLDSYIEKLKQLEDKQKNDLLRVKMQEYIEYIQQMLREVNIMNKDFYIVVNYTPGSVKYGLWASLMRALNPTKIIRQKQEDFMRYRKVLMERTDKVTSAIMSMDLKADMLETEQLIALMYNYYNPDVADTVKLQDVSDLDIYSHGDKMDSSEEEGEEE
jgi:hypothetical protein